MVPYLLVGMFGLFALKPALYIMPLWGFALWLGAMCALVTLVPDWVVRRRRFS